MKSNKVLKDSEILGGEKLRSRDLMMSEKYGGYRNNGTGVYANYVEPVLHAAEHTRRAVSNLNGTEFGRAMDEMKTVGKGGLKNRGNEYQGQDKK